MLVLKEMHNHPEGKGGAKGRQKVEIIFRDDEVGEGMGYGIVIEKGLSRGEMAGRLRRCAEAMEKEEE